MISDRALVLAAAATYTTAATWSAFGGTVNVLKVAGDIPLIAIEGTHDPRGWALDFLAVATEDRELEGHPSLGNVHAGFLACARAILAAIDPAVFEQPYGICGHSLGAALALLIAALKIDDGRPPVTIGAFAPPRVGMARFIDVVSASPIRAFRFGNDPVTDVPLWLPSFPYQQVPLIAVGAPMPDPLDCHHIENYVATVGV